MSKVGLDERSDAGAGAIAGAASEGRPATGNDGIAPECRSSGHDDLPYAVIMVGTEGLIETWSRAAREITGYTEAEIVDLPLSTLLGRDRGKRLELPGELRRAMHDGSASGEYLMQRKDGQRFMGELVATALWDSRDRLSGFSCRVHELCRLSATHSSET